MNKFIKSGTTQNKIITKFKKSMIILHKRFTIIDYWATIYFYVLMTSNSLKKYMTKYFCLETKVLFCIVFY